ncbi:MAG: hypothetical protein ACXU9U_02230 [Parachlamydiaceae bacterium]
MNPTGEGMSYEERISQLEKRLVYMDQLEKACATTSNRIEVLEQKQVLQKAKDEFVIRKLAAIQNQRVEEAKAITDGVYAGGKIVIKVASKEIAFQVTKLFSVEAAKWAGQTAAKAVPVVGVVIGCIAFYYRYQAGEKLEAVGELTSGLFCLAPALGLVSVLGPILSVSIDAAMLGHVAYKYNNASNSSSNTLTAEISLEDAYRTLNIESEHPTQNEVDKAYRQLTKDLGSDPVDQKEDRSRVENFDELMKFFSACKELIYEKRGWKSNDAKKEKAL